jgi:hypothetical protein
MRVTRDVPTEAQQDPAFLRHARGAPFNCDSRRILKGVIVPIGERNSAVPKEIAEVIDRWLCHKALERY